MAPHTPSAGERPGFAGAQRVAPVYNSTVLQLCV